MMAIDGPGLGGMILRAIASLLLMRWWLARRERAWLIRRRVLGH